MTQLPRAMLIDMDDTILSAYGRPDIAWNKVAAEFAAEFGSISSKQVAAAVVGQAISDEELDIQLARLTPAERETFMMLVAKLQGRWVEPPAIEDASSVETTATAVPSNGAGG